MSGSATRRYAELQCASHFSFLRGASGCDELFAQAAACGLEALAITDRNSVAGIVRAHEAAKATGVRLVIGCRLELVDETAILVYPTDRAAYSRLCRLLTLGKGRAGKGACRLDWSDLADHAGGLIAVLITDRADSSCRRRLSALSDIFGDDAHCALTLRRRPRDQMRLHQLSELAQDLGVKTVVTNDVLFHHPDRRILQDVLTCIREGCTIDDVGFKRERSADRHLKRAEEMHRLFARYPDALRRAVEIADRCRFSLDELSYQYPREAALPGLTPQQALERLTWEGAADRYPDGLPDKVRASLKHELTLIEALGYPELYRDLISEEAFGEAIRQALPTIEPQRVFELRKIEALSGPTGPGPGYDADEAAVSIEQRYNRSFAYLRHTLPIILADPDVRARLAAMRDEGLKDWEILSILANIALNARFSFDVVGRPSGEVMEKAKAELNRAEEPDEALSAEAFSDEAIRVNRLMFIGAHVGSWGLQGGRMRDPDALEALLIRRYGLRRDDVDHEPLF